MAARIAFAVIGLAALALAALVFLNGDVAGALIWGALGAASALPALCSRSRLFDKWLAFLQRLPLS